MEILCRTLGISDYQDVLNAMQKFTAKRGLDTYDELWITEHPSVYTIGLNRKNLRIPIRSDIPCVEVDRGGKITYHGPGQLIVYLLIDLNRRQLKVRQLVSIIENSIIELLAKFNVNSIAKFDAPGVYVNERKIASIGLRLKNNCCYHGLSLNVDMDLSPFLAIDPCGYKGLEMTQTKDLGISHNTDEIGKLLIEILEKHLNA